jgi:intracellular multiplication protein IcmK
MDKALVSKTSILVSLIFTAGLAVSLARGQSDDLGALSSQNTDVAKFQTWLKNNNSAIAPPARNSAQQPAVTTASPPPPLQTNSVDMPPVVQTPLMSYEQSKKIMLNSAEKMPSNPEAEEAFNSMMRQNMPLTPQQVIKLHQLIDSSQRAAVIPPTVPPKPVSSTLMINLAPGTTPPAIRLSQGYISTLVFVDSVGNPWPIATMDVGDPTQTNISWDGRTNILLIQAKAPYGSGNLVVRLAGLDTPLTLELVSGQKVVDYRTDIHVAGLGPKSKDLPTGSTLPDSANQVLLNVLDGVAPPTSKLLHVKGGDCKAWVLGDRMYLRTRLTVLSPGWIGRMTSPDGMYAYEIQKSSSVLVSQYGEPIELKIEGF